MTNFKTLSPFVFITVLSIFLNSCGSTNNIDDACAVPGKNYHQSIYILKSQSSRGNTSNSKQFSLSNNRNNTSYSKRNCADILYPQKIIESKLRYQGLDGYSIYSHNLCAAESEVYLHRDSINQNEFLKRFYIDEGKITETSLSALVEAISLECNEAPERIDLKGSVNGANSFCCAGRNTKTSDFLNGSFRTKEAKLGFNKNGTYFVPAERKIVYSGTFFIKGLNDPVLRDDKPEERARYIREELERVARKNQLEEIRRARNIYNTKKYTAMAVGFIQGLTYEFADEGVCLFLSSTSMHLRKSNIATDNYRACHDFLNGLYEEIKTAAPYAYLISNIVGMMSTDLSNSLGQSETRMGEALKRGSTACLEGILAEIGKLRYGEKLASTVAYESCGFGAALEGGIGFIKGSDKKRNKK